jgi:hypothetical protein
VDSDRRINPEASKFVYFANQWYEWDITSVVQRWVANPVSNRGLLLTGSDVSQEVRFYSSEWPSLQQRPKLTLEYTIP